MKGQRCKLLTTFEGVFVCVEMGTKKLKLGMTKNSELFGRASKMLPGLSLQGHLSFSLVDTPVFPVLVFVPKVRTCFTLDIVPDRGLVFSLVNTVFTMDCVGGMYNLRGPQN